MKSYWWAVPALLFSISSAEPQYPVKTVVAKPLAKAGYSKMWTRLLEGYQSGFTSITRSSEQYGSLEKPKSSKTMKRIAAFYSNYVTYSKFLKPEPRYEHLNALTKSFFLRQEQMWKSYADSMESGTRSSLARTVTIHKRRNEDLTAISKETKRLGIKMPVSIR